MLFLTTAVSGAFIAPLTSSRHIEHNLFTARAGQASMGLRLEKKSSSDSFGDIEREMLGRLGLSESDDSVASDAVPAQTVADSNAAEPEPWGLDGSRPAASATPRRGTQTWGRWSQEGESIELEIALPEGARARDVTCEVKKDGSMRVQLAQSEKALLSGRLVTLLPRPCCCVSHTHLPTRHTRRRIVPQACTARGPHGAHVGRRGAGRLQQPPLYRAPAPANRHVEQAGACLMSYPLIVDSVVHTLTDASIARHLTTQQTTVTPTVAGKR